jgi:hypothetical protein
MDRRERRAVLGQWGVRDADPREEAKAQALEADLAGSPLVGRPVELRRRHFRQAVDSYVASLGGPLPYMTRLRQIDRETAMAERTLEARWRALAAECDGEPAAFARRWRREAERFDFFAVNQLIERHNRWYPVEARLAMDVRRRDYVLVGGKPYARTLLDAAWVLERFPPRLSEASS